MRFSPKKEARDQERESQDCTGERQGAVLGEQIEKERDREREKERKRVRDRDRERDGEREKE